VCSLDFGSSEPCSAEGITYTGLADAGHLFSVQAIDGGVGGDASTWYWRVDLPPTAVITSGPPELTAKTKASFEFEADQPVSFTCRLDSDPPARCVNPVAYSGLARSSHTFSVRPTDEFGNVGAAASWSWTVAQIGATVAVGDLGFDPNRAQISQGGAVRWTAGGSFDHTVTDASGMGLFNSGRLSPGDTYTFPFAAAGTYPYRCTLHAQETGIVGVRLDVPGSALVGVPFTVMWAFSSPPERYVFDVQVRLPGSISWSPWLRGTTELDGTYTATAPGTYAFRSRIRRPENHASSNWSRPERVKVATSAVDR
jgi:plastocyanin